MVAVEWEPLKTTATEGKKMKKLVIVETAKVSFTKCGERTWAARQPICFEHGWHVFGAFGHTKKEALENLTRRIVADVIALQEETT